MKICCASQNAYIQGLQKKTPIILKLVVNVFKPFNFIFIAVTLVFFNEKKEHVRHFLETLYV